MRGLDDRETRRFTAEEVLRIVDVGVVGEDEPIELVDGRLLVVSPRGVPHALVVTLIAGRCASPGVRSNKTASHARRTRVQPSMVNMPPPMRARRAFTQAC